MALEGHGLGEVIKKFFAESATNVVGTGTTAAFRQALVRQVGSKIVSLLSVMAQERVAQEFLRDICGMSRDFRMSAQPHSLTGPRQGASVGGACILDTVVDSFIIPVSVKESVMNSALPLDCRRPEVYETNYNHCLGLLTIADFLKLVQSLYEIDPSTSERIRAMV